MMKRHIKLLRIWIFLAFCAACLRADQHEGNFQIRFEPTAKLQTRAPIPFQILVKDPLRKPLVHAKVTLQIQNKEANIVQTFPATEVDPGTYIAKPSFTRAGEWSIYVEVRRDEEISARTIQFDVAP